MKRKYIRKTTGEIVNKAIGGSLPAYISESIEKTCEMRKRFGLDNDRDDRIQRALRYQEFIKSK